MYVNIYTYGFFSYRVHFQMLKFVYIIKLIFGRKFDLFMNKFNIE